MRRAVLVLMVGLLVPAARADEGPPNSVVAAMKDATVLVLRTEPSKTKGRMLGSGFLVRVDGRTGYVATNAHVLGPVRARGRGRSVVKVVLRAGTRRERAYPAEVIARWAHPDLAVLRILEVVDPPAPIDVAREAELVESMPVYVLGFPFGRAQAAGRGRPSVVVDRTNVSTVQRDGTEKPVMVLIDRALTLGNSGGPIVDDRGRLVGVAFGAIPVANLGVAIAPSELRAMLAGRPRGLNMMPVPADVYAEARTSGPARADEANGPRSIELAVEVVLFDPFDKIGSVHLLYVPGEAAHPAAAKITPAGEAEWPPLANAQSVPLSVKERRGKGAFSVPLSANSGDRVDFSYQLSYVDGLGRTRFTRPGRYLLRPDGPAHGRWQAIIDPDGDCAIQIHENGVSFKVPGSFHDLNPVLGRANAPRVLGEVTGDFAIQVKVRGELDPQGPPTRHDVVPYNGAGLLVWLDADHCARLERAAARRDGGPVETFVRFELHDRGRPPVQNNVPMGTGDVYLKMERTRDRISAHYSADGKAWAPIAKAKAPWPERLDVGLGVVSSAFSPLEVNFEQFSIGKPNEIKGP